ncbi:MAG TPA: DUF6584 family protein [Rugosimonospora sp.]|nr:DUF6584 family protein [Rugosimonospora sp.]
MAKSDVLERVAAELAQGRTDPAIRRLSSLVAAHPADLDLRRRLAAVYRLVGNAVEAGRWSYLSVNADPAETLAFERAYPSPAQRLRRLRWPERDGHAATEFARTRLAGLVAALPVPAPRTWRTRPLPVLGALLVSAALLGLAVLGALTVAQWLIG